jgi:hypothetical protein
MPLSSAAIYSHVPACNDSAARALPRAAPLQGWQKRFLFDLL